VTHHEYLRERMMNDPSFAVSGLDATSRMKELDYSEISEEA